MIILNNIDKKFIYIYRSLIKRDASGLCGSATLGRRSRDPIASYCGGPYLLKSNLITCEQMIHVSDLVDWLASSQIRLT